MSDIEKEEQINFTKEAFLHPLNLGVLFLCTLTAFFLNDFGMASNIILTTTFGLELIYLGIIPGMPRFRQNVKSRKLKEQSPGDEDKLIFNQLEKESRKKFLTLKHLTKNVEDNFNKLPYTSQGLLDNIKKKMNDLLSNYLTLLDLHQRYRLYINTEVETGLKREIGIEKKKIENVESEKLKKTRERRLSILKKRLKKFEIAKERFLICETHLETIEDAIHYIYEQSMTMNKGDDTGYQLDNLLSEMEETSSIIEELDGSLLHSFDSYDLSGLDEPEPAPKEEDDKFSPKMKN